MTDPAVPARVVLCAVDRSVNAYPVAYAAAGVALQLDAALVLMRVDPRISGGKAEIRAAREDLEDVEHKCVSGPTGGRLRARMELTGGSPGEAIRRLVGQFSPLLVVMGTRPRGWLKRSLFGSTAFSLLRDTTVPLVVVPPANPEVFHLSKAGAKPHFGSVLVPVDLSEAMDDQLRLVSEFVKGTSTTVVLLNVAGAEALTEHENRLQQVKAQLAHAGPVEVDVRRGRLRDVLAETLADGDFGLVVLGRDRHRAGAVAVDLLTESTALVAIAG